MPYTPNPEIEKLKVEREHNEAKLRYHKNQLKALKHEESELNRKARNHRRLHKRRNGGIVSHASAAADG